jgi:taurine dioxygenase
MSETASEFVNERDPASPLRIFPVAGRIGAEIGGIDLADDLDAATVAAIRAALVRHKVIFFRDQRLDDASHEVLAARLGRPVAHPTVPVADGCRYLTALDSREGRAASVWHTDVTFLEAYPEMSILRAVIAPAVGGDTLWANCATAYDDLPETLRATVDGLWALHSNLIDVSGYASSKPGAQDQRQAFASTVYETVHPVVRVHPESGERTLLVGLFLKTFLGLSEADSRHLLEMLQGHVTRPENTVRWRWRAGDVAIWDNRATQHRAIADFGRQFRSLRRATTAGDPPVAIDGRRSYPLGGGREDAAAG